MAEMVQVIRAVIASIFKSVSFLTVAGSSNRMTITKAGSRKNLKAVYKSVLTKLEMAANAKKITTGIIT